MIKYNVPKELIHAHYLHKLVHHLPQIGIRTTDISFILQEPHWFRFGNQEHSMPDLVIGHPDRTASAIELKGSYGKRYKAKQQLEAGRDFIEEELRLKFQNGIFVVYHDNQYRHEILI